MRLASSLRKANPVRTPQELSVRGRAELRRLVGADNVPESPGRMTARRAPSRVILPKTGSPRQTSDPSRAPRRPRRTLWLAPSLAAVLLVASVSVFLGLSDRSPVTSYAFAETVTATVMPAEVAPVPLGTSIIFEIPYPSLAGQAQSYVVKRTWLSIEDVYWAGWTQIPSNLTFILQTVADDIGYYHAENWPYDKVFQMVIIGPGSSRCQGGEVPDVAASVDQIMVDTWFYLCAFALAQASPSQYSPPVMDALTMTQVGFAASGGPSTTAVEVYGTTQDPDRLIDVLEQFDLGMNGKWVSLPDGYKDWGEVTVPMGSCGGSLAYPFPYAGEDFAPGSYCAFAPDAESAVTLDVRDDGTCVIQSGEDLLSVVGITLNPDGTCTYTP